MSTMGGQAQHPGSVDGTSTNALFKKPWGLTVDLAGNLFVADYSNSTIRRGTVVPVAQPELQVLLLSNQVVLIWPAWATNYVLETSTVLDIGNAWLPVTDGISVSDGNFALTNPVATPSAFYRLRY